MNRKGFTLIELLAVIIILALITTITITTISSVFKKSKDNAEEVFKKELTNIIEDYITMNYNKFNFSCNASNICTASKYKSGQTVNGVDKSNANIKLKDLIDARLITDKDIVNPNNKSVSCDPNSVTITVKRNDKYVYSFETSEINCLTTTDKKIKT